MGPAEAVSSPMSAPRRHRGRAPQKTLRATPAGKHHSPGGWEETMHGTNLPRAYLGPHLHPATR